MARFERICPECGASNGAQASRCGRCGAPLSAQLTAPAPVLSRAGAARLAWRATKFLTRMGLRLAVKGARAGVERARASRHVDVRGDTIDADYTVGPETHVPARRGADDWRVWNDAARPGDKARHETPGWRKKL